MIFTFKEDVPVLESLQNIDLESGRLYVLPDGSKVPSVTTVLDHSKKHIIENWKKKVGEDEAKRISEEALAKGTAVHNFLESYLKGEKHSLNDLPDNVFSAFVSMKPLVDLIDEIYYIEQTLYSTKLGIAGRSDVICSYNGVPSIVDFKTTKKFKRESWIENYFEQGTAYALMLEELTGIVIQQIVIIIAVEESNEVQLFIKKRSDYVDSLIKKIEDYKK